jgi:hypothetical protein
MKVQSCTALLSGAVCVAYTEVEFLAQIFEFMEVLANFKTRILFLQSCINGVLVNMFLQERTQFYGDKGCRK